LLYGLLNNVLDDYVFDAAVFVKGGGGRIFMVYLSNFVDEVNGAVTLGQT
jgi:hypothetical protein